MGLALIVHASDASWCIPWHRPPEHQIRTASLEDPDRCDQRRTIRPVLDHESRAPEDDSHLREDHPRDTRSAWCRTRSRGLPHDHHASPGVFGSQRNACTPSRDASSGEPRQKEPPIRRRQATLTHGPQSPPSLSSFPSRYPSALSGLEPEGPSSPQVGTAPATRDAPPWVCPVDTCNPHFKDEHLGSARLRRSLAVGHAVHAAWLASPSSGPAAVACSPTWAGHRPQL